MNKQDFYKKFEDRFYAPREVIKDLRRQYLPFVEPLSKIYPSGLTFDIGCGRGEWLELMIENGFKPYGVDLDSGMLESCVKLGLPAEQGNAVKYLEELPSDSHVVITAFHVVEHITFEQLESVIENAFRVLKPGGLLIMETPNPENIFVATKNFYLDPTHIRPIPAPLLSFSTEFYGFERVKTVRLQECKEIHTKSNITVLDVLSNVSPDYAVIAQKPAQEEVMEYFDPLFAVEYGISISQIAESYDQKLRTELNEIKQRMEEVADSLQLEKDRKSQADIDLRKLSIQAAQLEARYEIAQNHNRLQNEQQSQLHQQLIKQTQRIEELKYQLHINQQKLSSAKELTEKIEAQAFNNEIQYAEQIKKINEKLEHTTQQLNDTLSNAHHWNLKAHEFEAELDRTKAELQSLAAQKRINDLLNSTSWRISAPLRGLRLLVGWLMALPLRAIKAVLRPLLSSAVRFALKRPAMRQRLTNQLHKYPRIFAHLRQFSINKGLIAAQFTSEAHVITPVTLQDMPSKNKTCFAPEEKFEINNLKNLTPRAKRIYIDLKAAIEKNKGNQ